MRQKSLKSEHDVNVKQENEPINEVIVLLLTLVFYTVKLGFEDGTTVANWFYDLGLVAAVTMIVCIETKIQIYRMIRAEGKKNGTWNDESRAKNKAIFKF